MMAEWFTTLSTNLSPSSAVGSNPGDGDLNLHEGKLPVDLRCVGVILGCQNVICDQI